jgi:DNA-binding transcriptional ArsR family regulator
VVAPSPLVELMSTLHVLAEPEHHPEATGWIDAASTRMAPATQQELALFAPLWARYRCRLFFPLDLPLPAGLDGELARVRELDLERFVSLMAQGVIGMLRADVPKAEELLAGGGPAASYVQQCARRSYARGELARLMVSDPPGCRDRLLDVLQKVSDEFFADTWAEFRSGLEQDAAILRRELDRREPAAVLAGLHPSASRMGTSAKIRFDKLQRDEAVVGPRPLVLIPSNRVWPHLTVKTEHPALIVVHYAVRSSAPFGELSLRELQERLSAFTSPGRMEVCRHLLSEPITTSELASRLGWSNPQVSRTLRQLRDAGLVQSVRDGRLVRHRLDIEIVRRLGDDLLATIMR